MSSAPASNATTRQRCPRAGLRVRQYGVIGRLVCSAGAPTGSRRVETRASAICRDVRPRQRNAVAVSCIVDCATLISCRLNIGPPPSCHSCVFAVSFFSFLLFFSVTNVYLFAVSLSKQRRELNTQVHAHWSSAIELCVKNDTNHVSFHELMTLVLVLLII